MRVDLDKVYGDAITVVNRLDAKDAALKQDVYYTTVIEGCMWYERSVRTVQDDGSVSIGITHVVQIPENAAYEPQGEWRKDPDRAGRFTLGQGDYIIKGAVAEEVTASTVRQVVRDHEPDAFQIQAFRDLTKHRGIEHASEGIMRYAEVYYIEG